MHEYTQVVVTDIGNVVVAAVDAVGALGEQFDADDVVTDFRLLDREGEPDVAEADDPDDGGVVLNLAEQLRDALADLGFRDLGMEAEPGLGAVFLGERQTGRFLVVGAPK